VVSKPVHVQGDPLSLHRAVGNLIDNALRVAPAGSLLTIGAGQADGWGYVGVADQGPGFDAGGSALGGSGLGLGIVEQVAQLHGGSFAVFSREVEPTGTTTVIWIPINGQEDPPSSNPL
jgi:signal transduction histidine kinase